jgi:glycosyltransferase involved in cell wall biosynthesis
MPSRPQISVVIPAYNAAGTVGEAVESILSQSVPAAQVIVVDDGSTDGTAGVLATYGDAIVVIRQNNRGLAGARTSGQAAATGEFIAWLDADDVALPNRLEVQVAVMRAETAVVVVASDFDAFDASGAVQPRFARSYHGAIAPDRALERIFGPPKSVVSAGQSWKYHAGDARVSLIFGNFLHPPTVMIRRSATQKVGPMIGSFPISEDWLYFVELSGVGHLAFIDEPLIRYRQSPDQMSRDAGTVMRNNLRALEYVLARNPEVAKSERGRVTRALGHRHRSLAIQLADEDRAAAALHILRALRYDPAAPGIVKALVKLATPSVALRLYRRLKATSQS